jgi:uncharacterized membrane protein YfcA
MSPDDLLQTLAVALFVGALIGAIGVGGVLLTPWLTHAIGLPIHGALGITMLAFVLPGAVALIMAARVRRRTALADSRLVLATVPGALAGALVLSFVPERAAFVVLAGALAFVGSRLVREGERAQPPPGAAAPAVAADAPTGFVTGVASALTGTWMAWRGMPLLEAIALGQLVQLPIAAMASAGNWLAGTVDVAAGLSIGAMLVPGMLLGQRVARRLPVRLLGRTVGGVLLIAAAAFVGKAI